jgi:surface protein
MNWMFYEASSFNQDISQWDVSKVLNMNNMFKGARSFINGPYLYELENWNVSSQRVIENLLDVGKTIQLKPSRYIITWDEWRSRHPSTIYSEYTCSICLNGLTTDETWRAISCPASMTEGIAHCFHKECIEEWFQLKQEEDKICPVCRRNAIAIKKKIKN